MDERQLYALSADILLVVHALFVAFVVLGLAFVLVGGLLGWSWVRNPWLRWTHLIAIGFVVIQSWLGLVCPLTTWEMALRGRAGDAVYTGSFVSYWVAEILYYSAPDWVFAVVYSVFGALVVAAWVWVTPRPLPGPGRSARRRARDTD
jgi:hypothetical protein